RSIFGLVAASCATSSRSPSDSDRVERLRSVLMKVASLACAAVSTCWPPADRPRVSGFGCSALEIWSAEITASPASARPAVIDSAAPSAMAVIPESLEMLVMVVFLWVTPAILPACVLDGGTLRQVQSAECDPSHW